MALESPAYVIQADSHPASLFRQTMQTRLSGSGVVGSGDLAVTANTGMSVNVAAGMVWIPGTLGATSGMQTNVGAQTAYGLPSGFTAQGSYCAYQDATASLTLSTSDPTNPRYDLIVASVQDAAYAGSTNQPVLQVVTGTPAPSPSAPAAPASSVVLAQITVGAGVSSIVSGNITDERPFSQPPGTASTFVIGGIRVQWGSVVLSGSSASTHTQAVTFPVAFSGTPRIALTSNNSVGYPTYLVFLTTSETSTGFTAQSVWADGSSHAGGGNADWIAIGPA